MRNVSDKYLCKSTELEKAINESFKKEKKLSSVA